MRDEQTGAAPAIAIAIKKAASAVSSHEPRRISQIWVLNHLCSLVNLILCKPAVRVNLQEAIDHVRDGNFHIVNV